MTKPFHFNTVFNPPPFSGSPVNVGLDDWIMYGRRGDWIVPDYQRQSVWDAERSGQYIGFLLEGGEPTPLIVQRWNTNKPDELVDGLQRSTAIQLWIEGEIPAILSNNDRVWLKDIPDDQQTIMFRRLSILVKYSCCRSRREVLELYLRINRGGVHHTDDEINRVRSLMESVK